MITPPNPRPQILTGQFPIHIKGSKTDPPKNCENMYLDYEKDRRGSLEIVPRLCLVANNPGSFRYPLLADELNVREVVTWHPGTRR